MPATKIRREQLVALLELVNTDIAAAAAIATSKLANGPDFIQRGGSVPFTADQSMGGFKVTNLGTPTLPTDAVTKAYSDALIVGLLNDRGNWDASVGLYPATGGSGTGGAVLKGDLWYISVAGTIGGIVFNVGDSIRALVNTPAQVNANWDTLESNIGYVPENVANKAVNFGTLNNTLYPSVQAVETRITAKVVTRETPAGVVNGVNTNFTLANTPVTGTEEVYLNGVQQDSGAGNDYTIAAAIITFLTAPLTGDKVRVSYFK